MIRESAAGLLLPTEGLVTVDLCDADTGRVLQREEAHNFLSKQSLGVAKWWQRMMWGIFNPILTPDSIGISPAEKPWFPGQHIAYWDDVSAEDAANEDAIGGPIVGWASRHPVGSPSGKRGVVNITESEFSDAHAKWVFDWTTSQGNGTFQSVGWTRMDETTEAPRARFPESDYVKFTQATGGVYASVAIWWDGTNWFVVQWNGSRYVVMSAAAVGGALTSVTTLPTTWQSSTSAPQLCGLARIGTDWITCGDTGWTGGGAPQLMRHTVGGTQVWTKTESGITGGYMDVTVDGSGNIWTAGYDGTMRRHNNSNGSITASVTPANAPTRLDAIAYDSADGNFWISYRLNGYDQQIAKVDGSGNIIGQPISLSGTAISVSSTSPYAGSYTVPGAGSREPYSVGEWNTTPATAAMYNPSPTLAAANFVANASGIGAKYWRLVVKDGEPWVSGKRSGSSQGADQASAVRGGTLGTRSRLSSPVTKTSAQTLKVTYQFNFS